MKRIDLENLIATASTDALDRQVAQMERQATPTRSVNNNAVRQRRATLARRITRTAA